MNSEERIREWAVSVSVWHVDNGRDWDQEHRSVVVARNGVEAEQDVARRVQHEQGVEADAVVVNWSEAR